MTAHVHPAHTITQLSQLSQTEFVASLDGIFEHSPWVAERTWEKRPFADVESLHHAMCEVMLNAPKAEQLALILAHPELAGKEAEAGTLTRESTGEQRGAGLDQCTPEELVRLRSLNARYKDKFAFPFIVAVKGMSRHQIMDSVEERLQNNEEQEFLRCLTEIGKIAGFRLHARFGQDA